MIPEVWATEGLIEAREANLLMASFVETKYEGLLQKGDVIHFPSVGNLAARAKSANTAVTYETVTETNTDVTVNQFYYAAIAVEDIIDKQAMLDQAKVYAPKMGYALALQPDDQLAGLIDDFTQTVGTLAQPTTVDNWIRAIQYLLDANAPEDEVFALVSPAEWGNLIKQDFFVRQEYKESIGKMTTKAKNGYFGNIGNVKFFRSSNTEGTNAAGHDNGLFHTSAIRLIRQITPTTKSQYDIDYLARKVVSYELYGYSEIRDDHGVWVKGL